MYQSIPSLTIPPPANPCGIFLKGRIPTLGYKEPWGRKIVKKPHPRGNYFQISSKTDKENMNETKIMENSTKMLVCLKHLKAQSFLEGGVYGYL